MMDFRRLQTFVEVMERGSFAAAAQALAYAPSAVSQQMSTLERELGTPLFERTGRSVRPTDAGEVLAIHVAQIQVALNEAQAAVRAVRGLVSGEIRLACFPSAGAVLIPEIVRRFCTRHPSVRVTVTEAEPAESMRWLEERVIDAAIVYDYDFVTPSPPASVTSELLMSDPMRLIVPTDQATSCPGAVQLRDYAAFPWIAGHPDSPGTHMTLRICRRAGFEPDIRYRTEDYLVMQRLVASGAGAAFVPGLAHNESTGQFATCHLAEVQPARRVHLARRRSEPSAGLTAMIKEIAAVVDNLTAND